MKFAVSCKKLAGNRMELCDVFERKWGRKYLAGK
jgi:hypothetical protein